MQFAREVYVRGERWVFDPEGRHVYPRDPKHYEPCWCFSGKKFKSCHMLRDQAPPPAVPDALAAWKAVPAMRVCLAPDAPAMCSGKIISAHIVQRRGGGLQTIARNGKVYGFKFHPMFFIKKQGRHAPELVGIDEVGKLPLFCGRHDRELFKEAETKKFLPTARQLLELNYRTVACRLYTNEAGSKQILQLYDADAGLSRDGQRRHFIAVEALRQESEMYLRNIRDLKASYDEWLVAPQQGVNALVLRFIGRPEFMCASIVYAIMDFQGAAIPPVSSPAHLCLYTVAEPESVSVVFAWIGSNPGAERLCSSLLSLPRLEWASALLQFAVEYIDAVYFQPDWWENLAPKVSETLIERLTAHAEPFRDHAVDALVPTLSGLSKLRVIGAEVVGVWRQVGHG